MPIGSSFHSDSNEANVALPVRDSQPDVVRARRESFKEFDVYSFCHDIVTACRIASLSPCSCIKLKETVTEDP
jgi:hypothetical protein